MHCEKVAKLKDGLFLPHNPLSLRLASVMPRRRCPCQGGVGIFFLHSVLLLQGGVDSRLASTADRFGHIVIIAGIGADFLHDFLL
jgi:hypothetical protein